MPSTFQYRCRLLAICIATHRTRSRDAFSIDVTASTTRIMQVAARPATKSLVCHQAISGGSSCWVEGPAWLDAEALALAAEPHGVLIEPGNVFFSASTPTRNCLRLGFSAIATERIGEGVERLAAALRELAPRA